MLTDPFFYAMAIPAVILMGLAKGGFAGVGASSGRRGAWRRVWRFKGDS